MSDPEILIIGGGPAGLTAGIYSARSGHRTLLLEQAITGGQINNTAYIENYPGFSAPVSAYELAQNMDAQARRFGCQIETGKATDLTLDDSKITVETTIGTLNPGALIICTGTQPRHLGVDKEVELTGRGISYCAICDGPFYKDKEVAVIGGGDSALEEAEYLTRFCSRVHLIHRRNQFRAAKLIEERVRKNPKIVLHLSQVISKIHGTEHLEGVTLTDLNTKNTLELSVEGLFIYVGLIPNTIWCQKVVPVDEAGFIITDKNLQTAVKGIFAAGDVRQKTVRQIATAVGDGALAAMSAHQYLTEKP